MLNPPAVGVVGIGRHRSAWLRRMALETRLIHRVPWWALIIGQRLLTHRVIRRHWRRATAQWLWHIGVGHDIVLTH
jgi:hypothetical protein